MLRQRPCEQKCLACVRPLAQPQTARPAKANDRAELSIALAIVTMATYGFDEAIALARVEPEHRPSCAALFELPLSGRLLLPPTALFLPAIVRSVTARLRLPRCRRWSGHGCRRTRRGRCRCARRRRCSGWATRRGGRRRRGCRRWSLAAPGTFRCWSRRGIRGRGRSWCLLLCKLLLNVLHRPRRWLGCGRCRGEVVAQLLRLGTL